MHFARKFLYLTTASVLIFVLAVGVFADTIRLKDGSLIKGKIINFDDGSFTVVIGQGTRRREMNIKADEIDSIQFDSPMESATAQNTTVRTPKPPIVIRSDNTRTPPQTQPRPTPTAVPEPEIIDEPEDVITEDPPQPTDPGRNISMEVKVLADNTSNGWTNTGWVVTKGQKIKLTGDGRVSLGNGRFSGPSGDPSVSDDGKLVKGAPTGALIAVIGDDNNEFLYIGASREFTASRDGILFLGVNEGQLDDNSGAFQVKIEISPGT